MKRRTKKPPPPAAPASELVRIVPLTLMVTEKERALVEDLARMDGVSVAEVLRAMLRVSCAAATDLGPNAARRATALLDTLGPLARRMLADSFASFPDADADQTDPSRSEAAMRTAAFELARAGLVETNPTAPGKLTLDGAIALVCLLSEASSPPLVPKEPSA
jgi:hypothetical protein